MKYINRIKIIIIKQQQQHNGAWLKTIKISKYIKEVIQSEL